MTRATLMLALLLAAVLPAAAAAQDQSAAPTTEGVVVAAPQAPRAAAQPPPPPPSDRKRRGSMVGYIQDGVVQSQIRVRFDAGYHNDNPDRAEFFYAKCGCYRQLAGNAAFDPNAPGPGPGIVTDLNFQQLYVKAEVAYMDRVSLFGEAPVRWIQPQSFAAGGPPGTFGDQSGISDVRAGLKLALVATPVSSLTVQVQGYFPTGDSKKGLGTNHTSVEPALLGYSKVTDRLAIESQVGVLVPIGGSDGVPVTSGEKFAGKVFFYGIGPSFELVSTDRMAFAPVVELVGWRVLNGQQTNGTGDSGSTNIVNIKFGARATFGRGSLYAGYGRALTDAVWYSDIVRVEYRVAF